MKYDAGLLIASLLWLSLAAYTKTPPHPPFQQHQGSSTAIDYLSQISSMFSKPGRRARVGARKRWNERRDQLAYAGIRELPLRVIGF